MNADVGDGIAPLEGGFLPKAGWLGDCTVTSDKQLKGIKLQAVRMKRDADQALNIKEFAVLAGVSYSVAREWFHLPGFPAVLGKVFWGDFVLWRRTQNSARSLHSLGPADKSENGRVEFGLNPAKAPHQWPPRAAKILSEVH